MQKSIRLLYILFSVAILIIVNVFGFFFIHSNTSTAHADATWAFAQETQSKSVIQNADGRLEFFIVAADGALWHTWQTTPGVWPSTITWSSFGTPANETFGYNTFTVFRNTDGRLEVTALAKDGTIWNVAQNTPNGTWRRWFPLTSPNQNVVFTNQPVALQNLNGAGSVEVFDVDGNGQVWHNWQGGSVFGWHGWAPFAMPNNGTITANQVTGNVNADGRLEIDITGSDGNIWNTYQVTPNGAWTPSWGIVNTSISNSVSFKDANPILAQSQNGMLTLFAVGSDGNIWSTNQETTSVPGQRIWRSWYTIDNSGMYTSDAHLSVMPAADNTLELFAVSNDPKIETFKQRAINASWVKVTSSLGYVNGNAYSGDRFHISPNLDGSGDVFLYDSVDGIYQESHQTQPTTNLLNWTKAANFGYPPVN